MAITAQQIKDIQNFCNSEPKTIMQIAEKLLLSSQNGLMSLYNFVKTQAAKTLFFIEKEGGFLWVRTNPLFFLSSKLDLILIKQNGSKTKKNNSRTYEKIEGLKRASPERLEAVLKLNRVKNFGGFNKTANQFIYSNPIKFEIDSLFHSYCKRVEKETIVLTRAPDNNPVWAQDLCVTYKTRFTSPQRQQANLENFRAAYKKASSRHMKGVFLTLTSNPRGSPTLWQTNQNTIKAWKKFKIFLNRALPSRAEWIKTNEFQKNGMLHFHVTIFGINWLLHKSVIQYAWLKYGGGAILDIHTIRNDPLNGWQWSRSNPQDSEGKTPGDHLASYLEKSMSREHGGMFWAMGIRNWTCSVNLLPKKQKQDKHKPLISPTKGYIVKGVLNSMGEFRKRTTSQAKRLYSQVTDKIVQKVQKTEHKEKQVLDMGFKTAKQITESYINTMRGAGYE